jgi:hypothetical protein
VDRRKDKAESKVLKKENVLVAKERAKESSNVKLKGLREARKRRKLREKQNEDKMLKSFSGRSGNTKLAKQLSSNQSAKAEGLAATLGWKERNAFLTRRTWHSSAFTDALNSSDGEDRSLKLREAFDQIDEVPPAVSFPAFVFCTGAVSLIPRAAQDSSGELDRDEVRKLVNMLRAEPFADAELDAAMAEMDGDGGGAVSFDEFK